MASFVKQLIESGIHFGHRTAGWNPKMKPYIYGKRGGIHIIDVRQTVKGMLLGRKFIIRSVAAGKDILFVGTKRQARISIEEVCKELGMPYVTERWLGGTLTNFSTIRSRLKRLEELEKLMDGEDWQHYSKKMASKLTRERRKITRNLGGIRNMNKLPGALVVVDVHREQNALKEAAKLGIPTICLIDTDSDPAMADIPIPGNDDAMRSIELVIRYLGDAIKEGKTARAQQREGVDEVSNAPKPQRRSKRVQFRADGEAEGDSQPTAEAEAAEKPAEPVSETPAPAQPAVPVTDEPITPAEGDSEAK